jgi:D-3-phosphoglycerate dehydrogenase
MAKPLVIQSEDLNPEPAAWLAQHCELIACPSDDTDRFSELLTDASGLLVRTYTRVNGPLLDDAKNLRVVGRAGVGVDNIDLSQCASRGITVVHTPAANTSAVSEYVTALMFDALRPRVFLDRPLARPEWCSLRYELVAKRQLSEMTLGILGMGRIGQSVARIAGALGMNVLYHDLLEIPEERRHGGARPVFRDELLASADILTVHVDGRAENRRLVNADVLKLMKPDAVLINTSRGMVIDAYALADHMLKHPGATALLDVHDPEPIEATSPLLEIPNVRLSPHIAACTEAAQRNMSWVVRDVWRVLSGEKPEYPAV